MLQFTDELDEMICSD